MTKEMLQAIYNEASEAALDIRADYRDFEAKLKEIKEEMRELAKKGAHQEAIVYLALEAGAVDTEGWRELAKKGAHQEAIVYLALEAGAVDTEGWRDNREEDNDWSDDEDDEDEDWSDDEDDDEDEDEDEDWYDPCDDCCHDCDHCAINN